ncbi:MAG: molybdenum cofactor biosynthesis protein [Candidatus Riflebacteria bacterium HGW-Riflebacteria-2]|jgi:molybdenum cofactor biosynthesis protein B|nr:MAG: molybdenum cofactor biosynthesis protein [Candidatus Riflebacteria bacterium HGW-Riflebacteria-2]
MGHHEHEQYARTFLRVGVMTFTDTRDENSDKSGALLKEMLTAAGHKVAGYRIVREDQQLMRQALAEWLSGDDFDAVVTNGGTGLTARDSTVEVARSLFNKEMEGFGEIFRVISYHQIGAAAMLSRACAGVVGDKMLICLPGSSKAVRLATARLIVPQLPHMLWEVRRQ